MSFHKKFTSTTILWILVDFVEDMWDHGERSTHRKIHSSLFAFPSLSSTLILSRSKVNSSLGFLHSNLASLVLEHVRVSSFVLAPYPSIFSSKYCALLEKISGRQKKKSHLPYSRVSEIAQSCPALCDPMDCSLPGSSIHGIFQARILEWVAISFSRGSSRPRDQTWVSHIVGRRFTLWATREILILL